MSPAILPERAHRACGFPPSAAIALAVLLLACPVAACTGSPPVLLAFNSPNASGWYSPGQVLVINASYDEGLAPGSSVDILLNNSVRLTLNVLSTQPTPFHRGSIVDGGAACINHPASVFIAGKYAYLACDFGNSLEIVDVTQAAAPTHTGNLGDGGLALLQMPESVFVAGNYAYVASSGSNALEIVDVSDPANPVPAGNITDGTGGAHLAGPRSVFVDGTDAYVTSTGSNALEIIDVSNPAAPVHEGNLTNGMGGARLASPQSVFVAGHYAYVASAGSNALEIVDISNPAVPVHAGSITTGAGALLSSPQSVSVSGRYAYIASAGSNALEIVDVSNPAAPVHAGSIADGAGGALLASPQSVYMAGNYAYIASQGSNALEIVSVNSSSLSGTYRVAGGQGTFRLGVASIMSQYALGLGDGLNSTSFPPARGLADLLAIGIADPLIGRFSATPVSGPVPLSVSFTDSSTGTPLAWNWSFGDGQWFNTTSAGLKDPSHTYTVPASYTVSLLVQNATSAATVTRAGYVTALASAAAPTPTEGSSGGDDAGPAAANPASPASPVSPPSSPTTSSVNVGGNSAVGQVAITGTGLAGVVVTGTVLAGPGPGVSPAPGEVYQYVDLVPSGYKTITGATITFSVPLSWLAEHKVGPEQVRLSHHAGPGWVELPTTPGTSANGMQSFSAVTPSFSIFAIISVTNSQTNVTSYSPDATVVSPAAPASPPPTGAVPSAPAARETTAAPPIAPQPVTASPFMAVALIGSGCVILVGSGFLTRRWWHRRQNPAPFRDDE